MGRVVLAIIATLTVITTACEPPVNEDVDGDGYLTDVDCDDDDPAIHPQQPELCDGIDNNCNDDIDEGVTVTFYTDADLDGFGDESLPIEACELAEGLAENDQDCDDDAPETYPNAEEICDLADNDCDDLVDEDVTTTFWADVDTDGFGDPEEPIEACELRDGIVTNDQDCDDLDIGVNPDADEVCDEIDNDCNGEVDEPEAVDAPEWWRDADDDTFGDAIDSVRACTQPFGYVDNDTDCDDTLEINYPGADELCDEMDNDCDTEIDEDSAVDATTWFEDTDEDGFGVDTSVRVQCYDPGATWSDVDGDCDDTEDTTYPGADEYCDGHDDDCDMVVDEDDAVDANTYYLDADTDTFGDPATTTTACSLPTGYVESDTDCDDSDPDVNPDADELCDSIDNDCDTVIDEDDAIDADTWYADTDRDTFGDRASTTTACSQPTGYVADDTDCDDTERTTYPGADEYCDGDDNDCDTVIDEDDAVDAKTWYLDADSDTYGDPSVDTIACTAPTGYVGNDTDCDDTDGTLNPDTIWYYDADGDGYGVDTTTITQCLDPGTVYVRDDGDCRPSDKLSYPGAPEICLSGTRAEGIDNDCDTVIDEECPDVHCGTIAADETWKNNTYGHLVTCNTYVQGTGAPILTVEAGAEVRFLTNTGLYIGYTSDGDIDVAGTTSSNVKFTSNKGSPRKGDYAGLYIGSRATGSYISGLDIEYAGGSSAYQGAIYVTTTTIPIDDSKISNSARHGIYVNNAEVEVTDTYIEDNDMYGLYCATEKCLEPKDNRFSGNIVRRNDQLPMRVWASNVAYLGTTSTYSGNTEDEILIQGGTVKRDATWHDLGIPYRANANVYVQDNTYAPVLTIDDGVEIQFATATGLWVGYTSAGDIDINGSTDGVTMTSNRPTPRPGDWYGLILGSRSAGSTDIAGLDIGYAGYSASWPSNIYMAGSADVEIADSTVHDGGRHGIYVAGAALDLTSSDVVDNDEYGVYVTTTGRLSDIFDGSELSGNQWPMVLPAESVGLLQASTTYAGNTNDFVQLNKGTVSATASWKDLDVPYYSTVDLYVQKASTGVTLTLLDGVELKMGSGTQFFVGFNYPGDLVIKGDRAKGIGVTIDSYSGSGAGSWDGMVLWSNTSALTSLAGFQLSDGGGSSSYPAGIYMYLSDATLSDCVVTGNRKYGIHMISSSASNRAALDISSCEISDTTTTNSTTYPDGDGLFMSDNEHHSLTMDDVTLTGNDRYPVTVHANQLTALEGAAGGSDYAGNGTDRVYTHGGYVRARGTWEDPGIPILVADTIDIQNTSTTPAQISTTDTEFEFGAGKGIYVGYSYEGDFIADKASFTSAQSTPLAGDWCGIYFLNKSSSRSKITNSVVEYGGSTSGSCLYGSTYAGNIMSYYAEPTLESNTLDRSGSNGVDLWYSGGASITKSTITNSTTYGIRCSSSSGATISGNTYSSNASGNTSGC